MTDRVLVRHILLATDFSASSDAALRVARDYARHFGARLHILHVVPSGAPQPSAGRASLDRDIEGGFVKRFMYTGSEGAFKPGKEGYEKIISKKGEEKKEKELYHESWAYLLGELKHGEDYSSEEGKKTKEKIIKDMEWKIKRGELGTMEEKAEINQKAREEANEENKEKNNLEITKKNREIRRLEVEVAEQRKNGEHTAAKLTEATINGLDKEISNLNKLNHEITVIDKTLDRHEKKVESYRTRKVAKSKPTEEKKEKKEREEKSK